MTTFADLQIGDVLPALDATITQELIDGDVTIDDTAFERSGYYGTPIAPPWVTHADFDKQRYLELGDTTHDGGQLLAHECQFIVGHFQHQFVVHL